jgi:hypothetical protein
MTQGIKEAHSGIELNKSLDSRDESSSIRNGID